MSNACVESLINSLSVDLRFNFDQCEIAGYEKRTIDKRIV